MLVGVLVVVLGCGAPVDEMKLDSMLIQVVVSEATWIQVVSFMASLKPSFVRMVVIRCRRWSCSSSSHRFG